MNNNANNPVINNISERIKTMQFKNKEELIALINSLKNEPQLEKYINNDMENQLLELYDKTNKLEDHNIVSTGINYENLVIQLEEKIRNKGYASKEELVAYINNLKNNGMPASIMSPEKEKELLQLYDELNPINKNELNLENYKGVNLENQNVIVAKEQDALLKTDFSNANLTQDFKNNQNELTAMGNDGLANADEVFKYMRDYKKEEMNLISLSEVPQRDNIDAEILNKIKFFLSNKYINPYEFKVDPNTGIFYNIETDEVLEVRKNSQTGKYELYKGSEKVYGEEPTNEESNEQENELKEDSPEEEMAYENKNVKVKRLIKPTINNNAFVKSSLLFITCIFISLVLSMILLYYK